jgi:predicted nucleic acid-binding protein
LQVVDCNVLVHLLMEGEQTVRARELLRRDADWRSDSFILVEFSNALVTWTRVRGLTSAAAMSVLARAHDVIEPGLRSSTHQDALALAVRHRVSAYDARYLAVARDLGNPLVTEDARLRKAAPALTRSLAEALAAS